VDELVLEAGLLAAAERADVLAVCASANAGNEGLVGARLLSALRPGSLLINVGRGSTVDEVALIDALERGALAGAGLDVFDDEPRIPDRLRALPNVTLTPHIGSATVQTRRAMGDLAIDNLFAHQSGEPLLTPVPECQP